MRGIAIKCNFIFVGVNLCGYGFYGFREGSGKTQRFTRNILPIYIQIVYIKIVTVKIIKGTISFGQTHRSAPTFNYIMLLYY